MSSSLLRNIIRRCIMKFLLRCKYQSRRNINSMKSRCLQTKYKSNKKNNEEDIYLWLYRTEHFVLLIKHRLFDISSLPLAFVWHIQYLICVNKHEYYEKNFSIEIDKRIIFLNYNHNNRNKIIYPNFHMRNFWSFQFYIQIFLMVFFNIVYITHIYSIIYFIFLQRFNKILHRLIKVDKFI